jgi:hypothetical protein
MQIVMTRQSLFRAKTAGEAKRWRQKDEDKEKSLKNYCRREAVWYIPRSVSRKRAAAY